MVVVGAEVNFQDSMWGKMEGEQQQLEGDTAGIDFHQGVGGVIVGSQHCAKWTQV